MRNNTPLGNEWFIGFITQLPQKARLTPYRHRKTYHLHTEERDQRHIDKHNKIKKMKIMQKKE